VKQRRLGEEIEFDRACALCHHSTGWDLAVESG